MLADERIGAAADDLGAGEHGRFDATLAVDCNPHVKAACNGPGNQENACEDEITTLDHELKVPLPKEIQRAREYGDLRENAEYKAAKERQSFLQARIGQLHRRLAALSP